MTTTPATLLLAATLAAGVAAGLLYLQRVRKPWLVRAHLLLALAATALVAHQVLTAGAASSGAWPLGVLAVAVAGGWAAQRVARKAWPGSTPLLAGHAVLGVLGFLLFLAWSRGLAGG